MSSVISEGVDRDVLPWLKLAEDLRALSLDQTLNVPQMCVMGDQSSGKSSVLEALSGIPFPRGSGLVTRCPIRLAMKKARKKEPWSAVVYTSVNPARNKCNSVTELQVCMSGMMEGLCQQAGCDFSTESVIVELVSEDCCDLTVVDLPGIIRTVTAGQSVEVIQQVNRLIKSYLVDKRTIILAIVPSNQDIATVDILERAQGVDPGGERTVGVLTKPDLIGPGSEDEVLSVLTNIRKPLKLGYIMLKNRSQKELKEEITTAEAREREEQFFAKHAFWKNSDPKFFGIGNLSDKLTNLLVHRIKIELSPMKTEVEKQLSVVRNELRSMSSLGTAKTSGDRQKLLVSVIQEYVRQLTDSIRGEYRDRIFVRNADLRLYTAALHSMEAFKIKILETSPSFKDQDYVDSLAVQIEQLRGRELPGFLSTQAFYMCMSLYVDRWEEPMKELLKDIRKIAQDVAGRLSDVLMKQYPALRDSIRFAASTVLSEIFDQILNDLDLVLEREKDPFTLNDFLQQWVNKLRFDGFSNAVDSVFDGLNPNTAAASGTNAWNAGTKDEVFIGLRQWYRQTHSVSAMANAQDMCAILEAYWSLSMKRFVDNCCMVADKELLCKLPVAIQDHMYKYVRDDASLASFFAEDPIMIQRRDELEKRRERLTLAASAMASIHVAPATLAPVAPTAGAAPSSQVAVARPNSSSPSAGAAAVTSPQKTATGGAMSLAPGMQRMNFVVNNGQFGIGTIVQLDQENRLTVGGFRAMPDGSTNPSQKAGILVGDIIDSIAGEGVATIDHIKKVLSGRKGNVAFSVLRKK